MSDTATLALPDPRFALPKTEPFEPLTLTDTCDQCGAGVSAYAQVRLPGGQLLRFCGHHYARHEATFIAAGYEIDDQRARLHAENAAFKGD